MFIKNSSQELLAEYRRKYLEEDPVLSRNEIVKPLISSEYQQSKKIAKSSNNKHQKENEYKAAKLKVRKVPIAVAGRNITPPSPTKTTTDNTKFHHTSTVSHLNKSKIGRDLIASFRVKDKISKRKMVTFKDEPYQKSRKDMEDKILTYFDDDQQTSGQLQKYWFNEKSQSPAPKVSSKKQSPPIFATINITQKEINVLPNPEIRELFGDSDSEVEEQIISEGILDSRIFTVSNKRVTHHDGNQKINDIPLNDEISSNSLPLF